MYFWNSFAFSMSQRMLAIWSLLPLPFRNSNFTSGNAQVMYCWSLAWRIFSTTSMGVSLSELRELVMDREARTCCNSWGRKGSDTTEQLNWTELSLFLTWVWFLGQKDPLEKEMATHSSILAWRIPLRGEPGRLQSMGSEESDTT